nr:MAG TPA: hypothetical protein [Caudoviricetes sp.]
MLDCFVTEDILGRVSIRLEMTDHDWSRLKTSGVWNQVEQILMESETQNSHCFHRSQTSKPEEAYCTDCLTKRFFGRFSGRNKQR